MNQTWLVGAGTVLIAVLGISPPVTAGSMTEEQPASPVQASAQAPAQGSAQAQAQAPAQAPLEPSPKGHPMYKGGPFGLGLMVGEGGEGGVTGKFWLSHRTAIQGNLSFGRELTVVGHFLWHNFQWIKTQRGSLPVHFGAGGMVRENELAARAPGGLSYIFDNAPVDIFLELVPTIAFFRNSRGNAFRLEGGLGARYYF